MSMINRFFFSSIISGRKSRDRRIDELHKQITLLVKEKREFKIQAVNYAASLKHLSSFAESAKDRSYAEAIIDGFSHEEAVLSGMLAATAEKEREFVIHDSPLEFPLADS